ncbi:response regulator transcription factor [Halomonas alkalisoli]|uniref:response regulator transcription factor n=1 Tax=Halomonas alkalisoli TaxID=2907158 RepID=UPI001F3949A1|nr:response regulator transcription factor [Halomonas alkalisoli]MCE9684603.1 response regulator transcription factor [Halomonas alkalisoli]
MIGAPLIPIRVIIIDPSPIIRLGLEQLLGNHQAKGETKVVLSLSSARDAPTAVTPDTADLILVDPCHDDFEGAEAIEYLRKNTGCHLLALLASVDEAFQDDLVMSGTRGIVYKHDALKIIKRAVIKVSEGEIWLTRKTTRRVFDAFSQGECTAINDNKKDGFLSLTRREREVITAVLDNPTAHARAIARLLHISERTLRNHLSSIYTKLGIASRLELHYQENLYRLKNGNHKP